MKKCFDDSSTNTEFEQKLKEEHQYNSWYHDVIFSKENGTTSIASDKKNFGILALLFYYFQYNKHEICI